MTNLTNLTMNTLVSMINALGGVATTKTFNARSKAVVRLLKIAAEKEINLAETFDENGNKIVKAEAAPAKKVSIRSVAEKLLTDGTKTYDDVLAAIKAEFPSAKTSVGCLRWYATAMRDAGVALPKRPRAAK